MTKPIIVCAACKQNGLILAGARHFDKIMVNTMVHLQGFKKGSAWEQGFIDQFGKFWTREEAYIIVMNSGQPFDLQRNGANNKLYSEGIY